MKAGPTRRSSKVLAVLGLVALIFILAAILIPHNMISRIAHDEATAMDSLHALTKLELRYGTTHPCKGFSCEFAQLKMEKLPTGEQIEEGFLFSDSFEGYKFSVTGCEHDSKGVVVRYRANAVPLVPGKTGVRAFCTDQTGELQYGVNGTAESCRPF